MEIPKHIITNKTQWMAGVTKKGPPVQPQIPQYTGNPLLHSILGTSPTVANNPYLYNWFPQYTATDPIAFNHIMVLKDQFTQYNTAVTQGKANGHTTPLDQFFLELMHLTIYCTSAAI